MAGRPAVVPAGECRRLALCRSIGRAAPSPAKRRVAGWAQPALGRADRTRLGYGPGQRLRLAPARDIPTRAVRDPGDTGFAVCRGRWPGPGCKARLRAAIGTGRQPRL